MTHCELTKTASPEQLDVACAFSCPFWGLIGSSILPQFASDQLRWGLSRQALWPGPVEREQRLGEQEEGGAKPGEAGSLNRATQTPREEHRRLPPCFSC